MRMGPKAWLLLLAVLAFWAVGQVRAQETALPADSAAALLKQQERIERKIEKVLSNQQQIEQELIKIRRRLK